MPRVCVYNSNKPVAIVGFAFRLPGADGYELWDLLSTGANLVTEVPDDRWSKPYFLHPDKSEPGRSYTFAAGTLGDVSGFDAGFFGISPREALQMDPQQRLLLEMAWEAFESGGIKPSSLRGSKTAVFLGYSGTDYPYRWVDDLALIDSTSMTGNTGSVAANRLSYWFDLCGPSMAVDTACSSSLVAFHQAWQSIQSGEVDQALVGGIALHLHPFPFVGFSKASMLSPTGRCRVFDAAGDGYVRSEGGGIFLLKDYEQAEADGDQIYAVVAGSGVNCDGHTNGITVPGKDTQAALLREVYERAGVPVTDVDYLEAHGTGTAVGDPIETAAVAEVFGPGRSADNPLLIGSVKSNLGHLETASGVAGLVKALYCLAHREVPPNLHFTTPNPHIPFEDWNLRVVSEPTPLPADKPLVIGVNSFGFGGANAHLVLCEAPQQAVGRRSPSVGSKNIGGDGPQEAPPPLLLSAKSRTALQAMAARYAAFVRDHPSVDLYDLAYSAVAHRERLPFRCLVEIASSAELIQALGQFAEGDTPAAVIEGEELLGASEPVFVFTGNGSQWAGMGQALMQQSALFREHIEEVDRLFIAEGGDSILADLERKAGEDRYALTEVAQPALFAIQVGVVAVLRTWGVAPAAVIGHSVGEVAAAWACGALDLAQAVRVVHQRSHFQAATRGSGGMVAAALTSNETDQLLEELGCADEVAVAGFNSPRGVTLAGPHGALSALEQRLAERDLFYRRLPLDYAFHSAAMDPIKEPLLGALKGLSPTASQIPFYSTVTGGICAGSALTEDYWWHNIREPVQFATGVEALIDDGYNVFVEIGPHALLRHYVNDCLRAANKKGRILTTLLRQDDGLHRLKHARYSLQMIDSGSDLETFFARPGRFVDLPRYPWQRETYWLDATSEGADLVNRRRVHALLGYPSRQIEGLWENLLDLREVPALADHKVGDAVLFPAAGFIETVLAAAWLVNKSTTQVVEDIEIRAPLLIEADGAKQMRTTLDTTDGRLRIESRARLSDDTWLLNAVCRLLGAASHERPGDRLVLPQRAYDTTAATHYSLTGKVGLNYGPAFQTVRGVWLEGDIVIAALNGSARTHEDDGFTLSPFALDGCFQLLVEHLADEVDRNRGMAFVPVQTERLEVRRDRCNAAFVRSRITARGPRSVVADFELFDAAREPVAQLVGVRFRGVRLRRDLLDHTRYLRYELVPEPLPGASPTAAVTTLDQAITAARTSLHGPGGRDARHRFYEEVEPLLDVLCAAFASDVLKRLVPSDGGFSPDGLVASGKVPSIHERLLQSLCNVLEEDGVLEPAVDGLRWVPEAGLPDAQSIWLSLLGDYPDHAAETMLAGRAGLHLHGVLIGELDPTARTPRVCDSNTFAQFVGGSPALRRIDRAIGALVDDALARRPNQARVRVLVLSGCQSRVAAAVVGRANFAHCDVVLGAGDADALVMLEELIDHHPAAEAYHIDLEDPPSRWGLGKSAPFDLIVLGSVLNEFADPQNSVAELRQLAGPGGMLAVVEQQQSRWADLVFGLDPAWWQSAERSAGLLTVSTPQQVIDCLNSAGCRNPALLADQPDGESGPYIVLADPAAEMEIPPVAGHHRHYLLVHDHAGYSAALAEVLVRALTESGHRVEMAWGAAGFSVTNAGYTLDLMAPEQAMRLVETLHNNGMPSDLVWLSGLEPEPSEDDVVDSVMKRQVERCSGLAYLMKALEKLGAGPDVWLVTSGAAPAVIPDGVSEADALPIDVSGLVDASLWGFGRSLMNEMQMAIRLVDLAEPQQLERMSARLADELLSSSAEDEVVLTAEGRFVARLSPRGAAEQADRHATPSADLTVALDFALPGPLKGLRWTERKLTAPGADEVLIDVRAAGLNFRDVMYAMGLLSDEAVESGFAGPTLGMELSGVVAAVGSDVTEFASGDPVIAFSPASFATRALTHSSAVVRKPDAWSFEAAATVPTTFFTSFYALVHLAQLSEGERVLIHGAAGGVGIAAVQLAKALGAEIFATAGSDEKRDFVRLLGADHVMDSRSLAYADEILALTDGEGVDVVLNSLAGEAINRNLKVLRPFGRFLELGKRDFYENNRIGLRPFRNNIAYFGIDADQLMAERPALTRRLFTSMMELFADGTLKPLPYRVFAADEVVEAFRYMQQSKQIGKVVVSFEQSPEARNSERDTSARLTLDPEATYMVTGGLAGFGARTASWLAERGARHLALLSRRGAKAPEARELLQRLARDGVMTRAFACDVTDRSALERTFAAINDTMPPLRGVVHAAMVIDDGLVRDLDATRIERVFAPKVQGALNLHALTATQTLDFFVLYSSATTLFGNPGQASYVAANRFLERLAESRRAMGLPAVCVAWGAIDDAGYLARNEAIKSALQSRMGGSALRAQEALDALEKLLLDDRSGVGVLDYDWLALQRHLPVAGSPRFSELARTADDEGAEGGDLEEIHRLVNELPEAELIELFIEMLKKEVGEILHLSAERIDAHRSVYELGMDSLMGMELVVAVESRFGVTLPVMALSEGPTIAQIVMRIVRHLKAPGGETETGSDVAQTAASMAAQHGEEVSSSLVTSVASAVESSDADDRGSFIR